MIENPIFLLIIFMEFVIFHIYWFSPLNKSEKSCLTQFI